MKTLFCRKFFVLAGLWLFGSVFSPLELWASGAYSYHFPDPTSFQDRKADTVIGLLGEHIVQEKETLLDIARNYDLGFNEMESLYPHIDPWIPPTGTRIMIPSQWILPQTQRSGIVINIAEMRLYYFLKTIRMVRTYPVGIGDEGWYSPEGDFHITEKRKYPVWYIPESLQEKYQMKVMPPGPDNPLGDYWLGLSIPGYGIHGTNFPWAIGRLVTHGCIRLYPEDMEKLFLIVPVKTPVEFIYEPVKVGWKRGRVFVEVHPDVYHKISDFNEYGLHKIRSMGLMERVKTDLLLKILQEKQGIPVDVTRD